MTRIRLKDADADVRWRIADRADLPDALVAALAADADAGVRWRIADRATLPLPVLVDGEWYI